MKHETLERLNRLQAERERHNKALETLAPDRGDGMKLWRKLRRIEREAHDGATAYCNGTSFQGFNFGSNETDWDTFTGLITERVRSVLGDVPKGFFVNGDARGYALKIDQDRGTVPTGMHTDWGRNGILAAEIND